MTFLFSAVLFVVAGFALYSGRISLPAQSVTFKKAEQPFAFWLLVGLQLALAILLLLWPFIALSR